MAIHAKVRDKKTGVERTTSPKAYSIIPHRYILLGYVDDDGNPVDGPTNVDTQTVSRQEKKKVVKDAEPAVVENKSGITREDLDRMNQEAIQKAKDKAEAEKAKVEEDVAVDDVLLKNQPKELVSAVAKPESKGRPKTKK